MIYDYLYYRFYRASHSKSFDSPLIFRIISVISLLVTWNVLTILLLMKKMGWTHLALIPDFKAVILLLLILLVSWIYFKSEHTIIVEKYTSQEQRKGEPSHPLLVILLYCGGSTVLFLLAATFANNR